MQLAKLYAMLQRRSTISFQLFPIPVFRQCPVADSALFVCEHSKHSIHTIIIRKPLNTSILPNMAHILTKPYHMNTIASNYGSRNREKKVPA